MFNRAEVYLTNIEEHKNNPDYLVDLYLSYAGNEIKLKQFKKAKSIFETATSNPALKNSTKLWVSFAKFYANRNKQGSTRKTYLRAVKQMTDEKNIQTIWKHFLQFENRSKMVPMSLDELKKLVNQTLLRLATHRLLQAAQQCQTHHKIATQRKDLCFRGQP